MAEGFCPQCGTHRQSTMRFCANCGFDYWKAAATPSSDAGSPTVGGTPPAAPPPTDAGQPQTSLAPPASPPRRTSRLTFMLAGIVLLGVAVVAGAILSQPAVSPALVVGSSSSAGSSSTPQATGTPSVPTCTSFQHEEYSNGEYICVDDTPEPTPSGPVTIALKQAVPITCGGADCLDVTVAKVAFATIYRDPQGFYNDTPDVKGDVFMAVYITYKATGPNADYNEFDWGIYVNDVAGGDPTYVANGPQPELSAGQLPQGKSAVGWIVYEVPAKGRITIAYQPNYSGSIFEVTLRAK